MNLNSAITELNYYVFKDTFIIKRELIMMKNVVKECVAVAIIVNFTYAYDYAPQKSCNDETVKEYPNLEIVKEKCLKTAKHYEIDEKFVDASYYYLLAGNNKKNVDEIKIKIKELDNFSNIAHSYLLLNELDNAKRNYTKFLINSYALMADENIREDFQLLLKLYPEKKNLIAQGMEIWNQMYEPFKDINVLYANYLEMLKKNNHKEAIAYMNKIIDIQKQSNLQNELVIARREFMLGFSYYKDKQYLKASDVLRRVKEVYTKYDDEELIFVNDILHSVNVELNSKI